MKIKRTISIVLFLLLAVALISLNGCGTVGANIRLEGLSLGAVTLDGKPLNGLPSDKINLQLDVAAQTVKVSFTPNGTVLTLVPSDATITVQGNSVSFKGLKPDQIKMEWAVESE